MMTKNVLLSIAVASIALTGQAQPTTTPDCTTSNPIGFIRCIARTHDAVATLKSLDSSKPFFIVFEGNEPEWLMSNDEVPKVEYRGSDKTYKYSSQKGNIAESIAESLTSVNSDFSSTFTENLLWIKQKETDGAGWPLNKVVQECQETTLTVREGIKLLKDKYHVQSVPSIAGQDLDQIVSEKSDVPVMVRQLVAKILRSYVAACYNKDGYYENSVAAFQVKGFVEADRPGTITIVYITVPKPD